MYSAQLTIERIQALIKAKGLTQKDVLKQCDINENTLKRMTDNKGMSSFYIAKIADRLDCSVDYLLGRTDNPNSTGPNITNNEQSNINGNNNINVNTAVPDKKDNLTEQFLQKFQQLDFDDKVDVMQYVKNKNNTV